MKSLLDDSRKETSRDVDSRFELATRTFMTSIGDLNQEFDIKLTNLATKLQAQIDEIRSKSSTSSSSASTSAWGSRSHDDSAATSPQFKRFKSSPAASASTRASSQPPTSSSGYSADPASLIKMGYKDKTFRPHWEFAVAEIMLKAGMIKDKDYTFERRPISRFCKVKCSSMPAAKEAYVLLKQTNLKINTKKG